MKQAIVLIHGIGEQKPMDTLRSFVSAVLKPASAGKEQFWSKPDPLSSLFELRRLQSPGRRTTHFYEYYWAYHVEGTKLSHLGRWFVDLLFRRPRNVPTSLLALWCLFWLLTLTFFALVATGLLAQFYSAHGQQTPYQMSWILLSLGVGALQVVLIAYLGDAARYLSSHPQNIALRQKIRADGVKLLKQLHRMAKYDRIVVVGHSLGSVIGYDIVTRLWSEYNEQYNFGAQERALEALLVAGQAPQPVVRSELFNAGEALNSAASQTGSVSEEALLDAFREAQVQAWKEQKRWGNPWRITDFVTIGSPLTHALLLLASGKDEFEERKQQRELLTCPPTKDEKGYAYSGAKNISLKSGKKFTPIRLHHAAAFAVTRWTNLYFPALYGLFGDLIGGPLRQVLGLGIKDVPVHLNAWRQYTPLAHTAYWRAPASRDSGQVSGLGEEPLQQGLALEALRKAIGLEELRLFK